MGNISAKNTRVALTIPKEMKSELELIARDDNRSFNNLVITILKQYLNNKN